TRLPRRSPSRAALAGHPPSLLEELPTPHPPAFAPRERGGQAVVDGRAVVTDALGALDLLGPEREQEVRVLAAGPWVVTETGADTDQPEVQVVGPVHALTPG